MRNFLMSIAMVVLAVMGLAACNNDAGPVAPSTKRVDSAVAAAPDTIKAVSPDSVKR